MPKYILCLALWSLLLPAKAEGNRFNVLLLAADDLNSWLLDDPNRYSGKVIAPNLRRFANNGVDFRRAHLLTITHDIFSE